MVMLCDERGGCSDSSVFVKLMRIDALSCRDPEVMYRSLYEYALSVLAVAIRLEMNEYLGVGFHAVTMHWWLCVV